MCKVSIVTICKDNEKELPRTLESVLKQDYSDVEYIIKDACSEDSTREIVAEYKKEFTECGKEFRVVTCEDNGIYNAMNQALNAVTGEWVIFMNAGDQFYDNTVISDLMTSDNIQDYAVLYGDALYMLRNKKNIVVINNHKDLKDGVGISQQVCLYNRKKVNIEFNEKYKILADFELLLRLINDGKTFKHVNMIVAKYERGGVSTQKCRMIGKEFADILGRKVLYKDLIKWRIKEFFEKYMPGVSDSIYCYHLLCKRYE